MVDDLVAKVKRKLDITWSDEGTDARVRDLIDIAAPTMRHKLGLPDCYDFEAPSQEQNLFLAWCFYEWNHAVDDFDANYMNDILQVRHKHLVQEACDAEA